MSTLDRREFIAFVGKACAGMTAAKRAAFGAQTAETDALPVQDGKTVHRGKHLLNVAMPMGGLGAGNVALGGAGNLRNWQIFNQCNPNAQLAASFFAIWAQAEGEEAVARLLQTEPVGKLPTIDDVAFYGEYPFAWLD